MVRVSLKDLTGGKPKRSKYSVVIARTFSYGNSFSDYNKQHVNEDRDRVLHVVEQFVFLKKETS